jgi:hypothetical protein
MVWACINEMQRTINLFMNYSVQCGTFGVDQFTAIDSIYNE